MDNNTLYFNDQEGGMFLSMRNRGMKAASEAADKAIEKIIKPVMDLLLENDNIKGFFKKLEAAKGNPEGIKRILDAMIKSIKDLIPNIKNEIKNLENVNVDKEKITENLTKFQTAINGFLNAIKHEDKDIIITDPEVKAEFGSVDDTDRNPLPEQKPALSNSPSSRLSSFRGEFPGFGSSTANPGYTDGYPITYINPNNYHSNYAPNPNYTYPSYENQTYGQVNYYGYPFQKGGDAVEELLRGKFESYKTNFPNLCIKINKGLNYAARLYLEACGIPTPFSIMFAGLYVQVLMIIYPEPTKLLNIFKKAAGCSTGQISYPNFIDPRFGNQMRYPINYQNPQQQMTHQVSQQPQVQMQNLSLNPQMNYSNFVQSPNNLTLNDAVAAPLQTSANTSTYNVPQVYSFDQPVQKQYQVTHPLLPNYEQENPEPFFRTIL
tara:strand:- start:24 stop:1328 length:1305 start_codon:yes stop_codon:yes gene_type:complete